MLKIILLLAVFFPTLGYGSSFENEFPLKLIDERQDDVQPFEIFKLIEETFNTGEASGRALKFLFDSFASMYTLKEIYVSFKPLQNIHKNQTLKDFNRSTLFFPFGYSLREMIEAAKHEDLSKGFKDDKKDKFFNFFQEILNSSKIIRQLDNQKVTKLVETLNNFNVQELNWNQAVGQDQKEIFIHRVSNFQGNRINETRYYSINNQSISNIFRVNSLYYTTFKIHEKANSKKNLIASGVVVGILALVAYKLKKTFSDKRKTHGDRDL